MTQKAIGLFDSGVGGLTVVGEVFRQLPEERILYFGDTANVPYGGRPAVELVEFASRIIGFLCGQGADYIIFACNTSSAVSLESMQKRFPVPMMGLIEPGAAAAVQATRNGRIALIATEATIRTKAYQQAVYQLDSRCVVQACAAPLLVPLVESGELDSPRTYRAVAEYVEPLLEKGVDTLILGCTHYPLLNKVINQIVGSGVRIIDPAQATVRAAKQDMQRRGLWQENSPKMIRNREIAHCYYVSGDGREFQKACCKFLGINNAQIFESSLQRGVSVEKLAF